MANESFEAKLSALKASVGMVSKVREGSSFRVVKEVLSEKNTNKSEALLKIFAKLEKQNVSITADVIKQVQRLLSNYLTYVRHPEKYKIGVGKSLIDKPGHLQVITVKA